MVSSYYSAFDCELAEKDLVDTARLYPTLSPSTPYASPPTTRVSRRNSAWPLRFNYSRADTQHTAPSAAARATKLARYTDGQGRPLRQRELCDRHAAWLRFARFAIKVDNSQTASPRASSCDCQKRKVDAKQREAHGDADFRPTASADP